MIKAFVGVYVFESLVLGLRLNVFDFNHPLKDLVFNNIVSFVPLKFEASKLLFILVQN
jgi:hypothetical protein